jgi:CubicO group peptidase (beta-lactamase class C family)
VERVTGDRLAARLHQRILAPPKLADTKLADTELPGTQRRIRGPYVHGYAPPDQSWLPSDGPAGLVDVTPTNLSWSWAAGAMVSSVTDLARFYQALLSGRLLGPVCSRRCGPPWTPANSSAPPAGSSTSATWCRTGPRGPGGGGARPHPGLSC